MLRLPFRSTVFICIFSMFLLFVESGCNSNPSVAITFKAGSSTEKVKLDAWKSKCAVQQKTCQYVISATLEKEGGKWSIPPNSEWKKVGGGKGKATFFTLTSGSILYRIHSKSDGQQLPSSVDTINVLFGLDAHREKKLLGEGLQLGLLGSKLDAAVNTRATLLLNCSKGNQVQSFLVVPEEVAASNNTVTFTQVTAPICAQPTGQKPNDIDPKNP